MMLKNQQVTDDIADEIKMLPKYSAEVLLSIPKHKNALMCLTEIMHLLDNIYSSMSYE